MKARLGLVRLGKANQGKVRLGVLYKSIWLCWVRLGKVRSKLKCQTKLKTLIFIINSDFLAHSQTLG